MTLASKPLVEIRGIAQSLEIPDVFKKDKTQLLQAISLKQQLFTITQKIEIAKPTYDARLMTEIPASKSSRDEAEELLKPYIARGLKIRFDEERWYMQCGGKSDEGTLRMPLRTLLRCADGILA